MGSLPDHLQSDSAAHRPLAASPDSQKSRRDHFRARFSQITRMTREHRHANWIHQSEYRALRELSNEGLKISQNVASELALMDCTTTSASRESVIDQLLTANEWQLKSIESQLQLILSTQRIADALLPLMEGLLRADGFPASRFQCLLDDLADEASRQTGEDLVPRTGLFLDRILEKDGRSSAWFLSSTIQNVRWAALLAPALADFSPGIQRQLLVAALLADIGRLAAAVRSRNSLRPAVRGTVEYRFHPSMSAAMVAGLRGGSLEWARLAAQHHERMDGSGFPAGLTGRTLLPAARCLSAIIRWSELIQQSSEMDADSDQLVCAAEELWRETRQRGFDSEVVTRMFAKIRPGLLEDVQAERRRRTITIIDPAHALAGPVFPSREPIGSSLADVSLSRGPHTRR